MNKLSKTLLGAALIAFTGMTAVSAQDKNAGVIDYELSVKIPSRGGDNGGGDDGGQVITLTQHFTFADGKGKLTTDRPDFGNRGGGGQGQGQGGGGRFGGGGRMRGFGGMMGAGYVDIANKKYLQIMPDANDTTKLFYAEEDYNMPKAETSDKTKKIAGYNCKRATVTIRDENYTVWYTTELPFSYSPINGLLPENGVVLGAESARRSFTAKKVEFKAVAAADVTIPANAQKITADEMREKRRDMMQRMRQQNQNQNAN